MPLGREMPSNPHESSLYQFLPVPREGGIVPRDHVFLPTVGTKCPLVGTRSVRFPLPCCNGGALGSEIMPWMSSPAALRADFADQCGSKTEHEREKPSYVTLGERRIDAKAEYGEWKSG